MQLLPASPRRRRRLARLGAVLLAALVVAAMAAIFKAPRDEPQSVARGQGSVYVPDTPVRVTPEMRREINATLDRFVPAAVLRKDLREAYELATPTLRRAATRDEWARGEIPVYPVRVRGPYNGWLVNYSIKNNVNLELMLRTTKAEKEISGISYTVDLKRIGGRWRVDSFFPVAQFRRTSLENGTKVVASYDFVPLQYEGSSRTEEQGKRFFVLLAFGIPALGLAFVVLVFVTQFLRSRRAEREYASGRL
jgi:hypothetical protein